MDYRALLAELEKPVGTFTETQRQRMADIVNAALSGHEFRQVVGVMTKDDFSPVDRGRFVWQVSTVSDGRDTLLNAFSSTARDRRSEKSQFFHFLKCRYALSSLKEGALQFSALKYFQDNDHEEYSEFLRRCQFTRPFLEDAIDGYKRRLFVLCLTASSDVERFWTEYADQDRGVCLCLHISHFDTSLSEFWDFRDVVYDDGSRFAFINQIRGEFVKEVGRELIISGVDKFARFYKRHTYSWESESRLTFDYRAQQGLAGVFPVQEDRDAAGNIQREYIAVPLKNSFFTLGLDKIICGKNVTTKEMDELQAAAGLSKSQVIRRK